MGLERLRAVVAAIFTSLAFIAMVSSAPSNITIDDNSPDPLTGALIDYGPHTSNVTWNFGQNCATCVARPDPSQAFDGTWHDGTFFPGGPQLTASVSFTGTAVYVMSISVSVAPITQIASLSNSETTFLINGTNAGTSSSTASVGIEASYTYNTPVFVRESLPLGRHNLTILSGGGSSKSLFLLDRIIYTTNMNDFQDSPGSSSDAPSPSSASSRTNTISESPPSSSTTSLTIPVSGRPSRLIGVIIGVIVVSVIALLVLATAWIWVRRRTRSRATMLSSRPFEVADTVSDESEVNPPEYESVIVDIVDIAEPTSVTIARTHLNSIGQAGTKQLIARLVAAPTTTRTLGP